MTPDTPRPVIACEACGVNIADELDTYEVQVRPVRRRNVPTVTMRLCQCCALAVAHSIQARVEAIRSRQPQNAD